jgi:hypothetical protein
MHRKHPLIYALLFAVLMLSVSPASPAQVAVGVAFSVRLAPPALPVYEQPLCPGPGYLWTPGYWAWDDDDGYYWVPGTWVIAPVGLLWTPGYWGWHDGFYLWHAGYWGPHIGFYGGVNYGFGYGGVGFVGGEWRGGTFFYNTAVMRVDTVHITNVYVNRSVIVNNGSHVSFNGGRGGVNARPTRGEEIAAHEHHTDPLPTQLQHQREAGRERQNFASQNHGRPAIAATARPGEFKGHGVVAARTAGAAYHPPAMSPKEARASRPTESRSTATAKNNNRERALAPPAKNNSRETSARENKPRDNNARQNKTRDNKARDNKARDTQARANNARPGGSRANKSARNNARPSSQSHPASHATTAPRENNARNESPRPQREARAPQPRSAPRAEPRAEPRSQPRVEARNQPAPRVSAPRREAAPRPAPHQSAPREEKRPNGR